MECAIEKREELPRMGRYNQDRVSQWSWDEIAQRTLTVYRCALHDKRVTTVSTAEQRQRAGR
jgi:hypothetical protein